MQRVVAVVLCQLPGFAVEFEAPAGDAVGIATGDRAEERVVGYVVLQAVVAESDVAQPSVAIRNADRHDDAAVLGDAHFGAGRVGQREELHRSAFDDAELRHLERSFGRRGPRTRHGGKAERIECGPHVHTSAWYTNRWKSSW